MPSLFVFAILFSPFTYFSSNNFFLLFFVSSHYTFSISLTSHNGLIFLTHVFHVMAALVPHSLSSSPPSPVPPTRQSPPCLVPHPGLGPNHCPRLSLSLRTFTETSTRAPYNCLIRADNNLQYPLNDPSNSKPAR